MLVAAAVCPHPPALVPEAAGAQPAGGEAPGEAAPEPAAGDGRELGRLRAACDAAVASLLAARPDLVAVAGGGERTARYPASAAGGLAAYGVPFTIGRGAPVLPLSLTIGRWLLGRARPPEGGPGGSASGPGGPDAFRPAPETVLRAVADGAPPAECLALGREIAALAPRVVLLAMGDGPGRRARRAPGAADAAADRYDAEVTAALAKADAGALAALGAGDSARLFAAGRAAWQVLAGAAAGRQFDGHLGYAAAPFEVSYYVATWHAQPED